MKLLADETRYKIVELLLQNDYCVGALATRLGISDAAVSQHLQILRKGGLLKGEKRGYWTHYVVERNVLTQVAENLRQFAALSVGRETGCPRESIGPTNYREGKTMCKCQCEHPEKLQESPDKCSKEQIEE
ncbi:MAG: metalloregulator ArsR/SmtB family transcription factor [Negativicutes bacterium]|nr:metalloregulator ArsR/SmtB family transcription factor [Negativicutes bacterium]